MADGRREAGRARRAAMGATGLAAGVWLAGCQGPLQRESPEDLHRALVESVRREVDGLPVEAPRRTERPPSEVEQTLAERLDELAELAGPLSYADAEPDLGEDLLGEPQEQVALSLREAIQTAVQNNLEARIAQLQPAIAEAEVARAEAVFDALFYTNVDHLKTDEPQPVPILGGIPLGSAVTVREDTVVESGIRQPLVSGGSVSAAATLERSELGSRGIQAEPDPAYAAGLALALDQPLLEGFGRDVSEAQILLARNQDRRAILSLKATLLETVARTETAYWNLAQARMALLIQERLLERGLEVLDILERRRIRDASIAEIADARAVIEQRRAEVIRARRALRTFSDQLKALVNNPRIPVASETLLLPIDELVESPLVYDVREAIAVAVEERPEVSQALLDLDDRSIDLGLADDSLLPRLDVSARMEFLGLEDNAAGAFDDAAEDTFVNYILGLVFEAPIGNRADRAAWRAARLRQTAAVLGYRRSVQQVVLDVKTALRDVVTAFELIEATRSFRLAQAENLRVLRIEIENRLGFTPESLNLLFQRQEVLAQAELQEIQALTNFNVAVAELYRAMGVGLDMNRIELRVEPPGPA